MEEIGVGDAELSLPRVRQGSPTRAFRGRDEDEED